MVGVLDQSTITALSSKIQSFSGLEYPPNLEVFKEKTVHLESGKLWFESDLVVNFLFFPTLTPSVCLHIGEIFNLRNSRVAAEMVGVLLKLNSMLWSLKMCLSYCM